jgi:hypothetical protein
MGNYKMPSHDVVHKPGDEGSCPSMPTESINGQSFPNGDQSVSTPTGEISLPFKADKIDHSGGQSSDPKSAMPGA